MPSGIKYLVIFVVGAVSNKKPWQEEVIGGPVATKKQGQEKELIYKNKYSDDDVKMMKVGDGKWSGNGIHNSYNIKVVKEGTELTMTPRKAPDAQEVPSGTTLVGTQKLFFGLNGKPEWLEIILPSHKPIKIDLKLTKDDELHPVVKFCKENPDVHGAFEDKKTGAKFEVGEQIRSAEAYKAEDKTEHDVTVEKIYERKDGVLSLAVVSYKSKYLSLRLADFSDISDETKRMTDFSSQDKIKEEIEQARAKLSVNLI